MDQRIIVVGQSHARALIDGYESLAGAPGSLPPGVETSFIISRPDRVIRYSWSTDGYVTDKPKKALLDVVAKCDPTRVVLAWGGNQMNLRALVATDRPFDVLLPSPESTDPADPADPATELIPCAAVARFVRLRLEQNEMLGELIADCAKRTRPMGLLLPPPPIPEPAVRQRIADEPYFSRVLAELGTTASDIPIVPDAVRQRLWVVMTTAYRSFAQKNDVTVLEPPADGFDTNGMLVSNCWGRDVTHANSAYGALALQRVFAWAMTGSATNHEN